MIRVIGHQCIVVNCVKDYEQNSLQCDFWPHLLCALLKCVKMMKTIITISWTLNFMHLGQWDIFESRLKLSHISEIVPNVSLHIFFRDKIIQVVTGE